MTRQEPHSSRVLIVPSSQPAPLGQATSYPSSLCYLEALGGQRAGATHSIQPSTLAEEMHVLPAPLGTIGAWLYRAEVALREEITIQQVHEETANTIQRKREQHKVNTLAGKPSSITVLVLPNQVCLPITQRVKG